MSQMTENEGYWNKDLMCNWLSIEALPPNGIVIKLPEMHCVDFDGVLRVAKRLVPDVELIQTWSGAKMDACYLKFKNGWWLTNQEPACGVR